MEQILYRTYVIQNSHFWAKLSLSACETFLSLNLVCIWCPIFNARVQSFKESRTVTMESFSTELIEAITHRCSIKSCSQNIEGTYNRTSVPKYEFMCVVCVCVCVCVFLHVRVFLYSSTVKASSDCKMSETYLRGTDQRCYVVSTIPGASANFLHLDIWKCNISPPKTKLQHTDKLERNDMVYSGNEKMIYIDIGYKSSCALKPTSYEKILR